MEILAIIVAVWLLIAFLYGAISWLNASRAASRVRVLRPRRRISAPRPRVIAGKARALPVLNVARDVKQLPAPGNTTPSASHDVDVLRAQVEYLRSELVALSSVARVADKPRRLGPGTPAQLSRPLRREVREARVLRRVRGY